MLLLLVAGAMPVKCANQSMADSLLAKGYELYCKKARDTALVVALLRQAADAGSEKAVNNLLFLSVKSDSIWYRNTFRALKSACEQGNNAVVFNLAVMYLHGLGVKEDPAEADRLMSKFFATPLGENYRREWMDAKRDLRVVTWVFFGPSYAHTLTAYSSGAPELFRKGIACYQAKQYKEAVDIFSGYASNGSFDSQCNLGFCYWFGYGVDADRKRAAEYYQKAAAGGSVRARFTLATLYATGNGLRYNAKLAEETYDQVFKEDQTRYSGYWEKTLKHKTVYLTFIGDNYWSIIEEKTEKR